MKDFVQPKGMSTSGDNAALKQYLLYDMDNTEFEQHIVVPARCTFNSDAMFIPKSEAIMFKESPELIKEENWYRSVSHYHKGELVAHVAGKSSF